MKLIKFLNSNESSMESYNALNSASLLKAMGHSVYIMSAKSHYLNDFCNKNKITFVDMDFSIKLGFLKLPEVDIIEIYGYNLHNYLLLKKLISMNTPVILNIYSFPDNKFIEFIRDNINNFSKIIVPFESIKDELVFNDIDDDKIFVNNPLLLLSRWESAKQIKPAIFLKRPYRVITVYRKQNLDNIKFFLSVAKKILSLNQNINFSIIGLKNDALREYARELGISHKVDMLGWRDDIPEIMAMSHIYVRTDKSPDVSRSLIEAMASSVVCVVPQIKGISDVIISDYNGVIVEPENEKSYVKSIISLINEPIRMQNLSNMAYNYAKANFSSNIVVRVEEILCKDVIMENRII
jgi:glycosyltransferase involved in cell wall biosynthesis